MFCWLGHEDFRQSLLNEGDLMRRGGFRANSHRQTSAVCDRHDFCSLTTFGFPDAFAPFLAGASFHR